MSPALNTLPDGWNRLHVGHWVRVRSGKALAWVRITIEGRWVWGAPGAERPRYAPGAVSAMEAADTYLSRSSQ